MAAPLVALMAFVVACAAPPVRARAHNLFEQSHRWGGWTGIALFWVLTVHLALSRRADATVPEALVEDWHVWVLATITACIVWPWVRLRRVPVTVERPSAHVAIVHFDYGVRPAYSSGVGISRSPLDEWHAFATVTAPNRPGYRMFISRAGDWTGRFIDDPPSHVWVRGVPVVAPMAKVAMLYERRGVVRRQQQADHAPPGRRPGAARDPVVRPDLGLLKQPPGDVAVSGSSVAPDPHSAG